MLCKQFNNFNKMNDFTIISLPRVNLELPPTSFDLKSLKVSLQPSMPCHYNLKTV